MTNLTPATLALFIKFAKDSDNWNGQPLVGGNFDLTSEDKGHLTDLKKKGFVKTFTEEGNLWLDFTASGKELALANGIKI